MAPSGERPTVRIDRLDPAAWMIASGKVAVPLRMSVSPLLFFTSSMRCT
jgi:hypothetical protein